MIDMIVETIWGLFRTIAWVGIKIAQLGGGLLLGHVRTRIDQRGYQPVKLGETHELAPDLLAFTVTLPKSHVWNAETTLRFVSHVVDLGRCLLQVIADHEGIVFR